MKWPRWFQCGRPTPPRHACTAAVVELAHTSHSLGSHSIMRSLSLVPPQLHQTQTLLSTPLLQRLGIEIARPPPKLMTINPHHTAANPFQCQPRVEWISVLPRCISFICTIHKMDEMATAVSMWKAHSTTPCLHCSSCAHISLTRQSLYHSGLSL